MAMYRYRIIPRSGFATPIRSDTLYGHLLWAAAMLEGESRVNALIEAFVDGGPDAGTKAATEVILAGTDRIAMDAVGVAILRLFGTTAAVSRGRVFEQEQIARAVELGLGVDAPEKIHITTGDDASATYAEEIREILLA